MKHEEELKEVYNRLPFLKIIAENQLLWENLVFISNIWMNVVILMSFHDHSMDVYDAKWRFIWEIDWTFRLMRISGIINLILTGIIIWNFVLKRAPLIFKGL